MNASRIFQAVGIIVLFSCTGNPIIENKRKSLLFANSIVSTDIDFIKADDPSAFVSLKYQGQKEQEMPDRRKDVLMDDSPFVFEADFADGNKIEIWVHSSFNHIADAEIYAQMITGPLGKLPEQMRKKLHHVVIHKGDQTAFGESDGHFFVIYSENMETRYSNHDLEETVFHESVHATLEYLYKEDPDWLKAQKNDNTFITEYAANNPRIEDLPETALFAYTMLKHPGRLSPEIEEWIRNKTPNRLNFFKNIFYI